MWIRYSRRGRDRKTSACRVRSQPSATHRHHLSYPPQVACEFSKPIRDLLGYRIHRPNLGGYEGQDPAVLFETQSHTLAAVDAIPPAVALQLQAHYQNRAAGSQG